MPKAPRIFVVEDDESIRMLLEVALRSSRYTVSAFPNAADALAEMENTVPDAAVLDIMLDGMDGITALKLMRANARLAGVPVMMLTAKDSENDKIIGLDAGADDYMTKPYNPALLLLKIEAIFRRIQPKSSEEETEYQDGVLKSGGLKLVLAVREATRDGALLELTYKEFELLRELMENAPGAMSRDELLQSVWGYDFIGETRTLDMHIGTLRHKLGDESTAPRYIKTVRGVGYRFLGEVEKEG